MKFTLEIDCDNEAFEPEPFEEVARILQAAGKRYANGMAGDLGMRLRDINGNTVGRCGFNGH